MAGLKIAKKWIPQYEQIIAMNDDKINVLILGTSGCGKSTLINAILEANKAPTGIGEAITKEIAIYQNKALPFRMIDTVGYEYGIFKQNRIKRDIAKFSMEGVKTSNVEKLIHMIWFCIDGTTKRIDQEVLGYIKSVTNSWKNVPVIVVFTKSYSRVEIAENIDMAKAAIDKYNANHRRPLNVKSLISKPTSNGKTRRPIYNISAICCNRCNSCRRYPIADSGCNYTCSYPDKHVDWRCKNIWHTG